MFQFLIAAALVAAQPSEPNADSGATIALAESRGLRLYEAYRIAPNAMAKAESVGRDRLPEINGYVVINSANDQLLTFVGRSNDGEPYAVWRGRFRNGVEIDGSLVPRASKGAILSADEHAIFDAERVALSYVISNQDKLGATSCAGDIMPNMVVLRPTAGDPSVAVYIMTPQIDKDVVSLGGHYRVILDRNSRVKSFRALSDGCHEIDLLHDGQRLVADYVGHRLDPYPNEIHVFASLATNARIMVETGQKHWWKVERGKIAPDDTPPTD